MSSTHLHYPKLFVYGQFIGRSEVGFTVVAFSSNTTAQQAERARHEIVSLLPSSSFEALPVQVFSTNPNTGTIFLVRFEQSQERQVGRQVFRQERYSVWDRDSFAQADYRFWSIPLPPSRTYTSLEEMPVPVPSRVYLRGEVSFLSSQLRAQKVLLLNLIDAILAQEESIHLPSTDVDADVSLVRAIHLLLPKVIRASLTFAIRVPVSTRDMFKVCFSVTGASWIYKARTHSELQGADVPPPYSLQLELYLDTHSSLEELADLINIVSNLPSKFGGSWRSLGKSLSTTLWERIGLSVVSRLYESGRPVNLADALFVLRSDLGGEKDRRVLLNFVADELRKAFDAGQDVKRRIDRFALAIKDSRATRAMSGEVVCQRWESQPLLALLACDTLVTRHGFAKGDGWNEFILPVLRSLTFSENEEVAHAIQWLESGQITVEHFFEFCDLKHPVDLYASIYKRRLLRHTKISDLQTLANLAAKHSSLHQLHRVLVGLNRDEAQPIGQALSDISRGCFFAYEGLILLLLEELFAREPLLTYMPRLLQSMNSVARKGLLPRFSAESMGRLINALSSISAQSREPDTTKLILELGKHLGAEGSTLLRSLDRTAQLLYYVDAMRPDPDRRSQYLEEVATLIMDPETSLEDIAKQDLAMLTVLYRVYNMLPVVRRLLAYSIGNPEVPEEIAESVLQELSEWNPQSGSSYGSPVSSMRRSKTRGPQLPCPECDKLIQETTDAIYCPECGRAYHKECWEKVGRRCVKLKCKGHTNYSLNPFRRVINKLFP